jgi:DNA-binding NarL/FixJ family response regulator
VLRVSLSTVENHIQAIFDKLELSATPACSCRVPAILRHLDT